MKKKLLAIVMVSLVVLSLQACGDANEDGQEAKELSHDEITMDGIVNIVSPENTFDDISLDSLRKIYLGEIDRWEDVKLVMIKLGFRQESFFLPIFNIRNIIQIWYNY